MECWRCHVEIKRINYGLGETWVHIDPKVRYPYWICKPAPVAEPADEHTELDEWADHVLREERIRQVFDRDQ